ncbi:MAG: PAS domain S-box protein [Promethearchaeota archaeon]
MIGLENEIFELEETYPFIIENINDLIAIIKLQDDFKLEYINERIFLKLLGYTYKEVFKNSILDYIHPDDKKFAVNYFKKETKIEKKFQELRIKSKSGEYKWFEVKKKEIKKADNQKILLLILRDLSQQKNLKAEMEEKDKKFKDLTTSIPEIRFWKLFTPKKYEEALKSSYEMLQMVMDTIPENIFWKDTNLIYLGSNKNYATLIGAKNPQNVIGKSDSDFLTNKKKVAYLKKHETRVINSDNPEIHVIEPWIFDNGEKIWFDVNRIPLYDSLRKTVGILVTYEDVTEKLIAEQKLIESEEKFRTIAEQSLIGIAILQDGYFKYMNDAVSKITEYSIKEMLNQPIENLEKIIHTEDLSLAMEFFKMKQAMEVEIISPSSFRLITKYGKEKWIEAYSKTILYEGKNAKLIIINDITEKIEVQRLILEENFKLLELDRIREELMTRVTHELKTPLISVYSGSELLLDSYNEKTSDEILEILKIINRGGKKLNNLVDKLLDISKMESKRWQLNKLKEDLSEIIKECVQDMIFLAKKREISIKLVLPQEIYLEIDEYRITQVLINLLSNAIKNTPKKGIINVSLNESENYVDIIIKDTGVGLTEKEMNQIFKKFGKVERYGKQMDVDIRGSGLGLYISKEIVELHGGRILVESEGRNKGSTFTVRLLKKII